MIEIKQPTQEELIQRLETDIHQLEIQVEGLDARNFSYSNKIDRLEEALEIAISALNKIEKHIWLPHQITDRDDLHCEIHKALFIIKETLKKIQELRGDNDI